MTDLTENVPQVAKAFLGKLKNRTPDERADQAVQLVEEVVDLLYLVISAHAANRIVNYSDFISSQIGRSYAGNAFIDLQRALIETEILRLVRLWDNPDPDKISIPTAYWLTKEPAVRKILDGRNTAVPEAYPGYRARRIAYQERLWGRLDRITPRTIESDLLIGLRNFRDKRVAHWLLQSKADRTGAIKPVFYGHERQLLIRTIAIANVLNLAVRAAHFDFKSQWKIAQKNAEAFWHGCKITPLE